MRKSIEEKKHRPKRHMAESSTGPGELSTVAISAAVCRDWLVLLERQHLRQVV